MITQEEIPLRIPGYSHVQDTQLITRLEGSGNYTIVHLRNDLKPLLVSQTLKRFERLLPDFIRISKSDLVNPSYVQRVMQKDAKVMYVQLIKGPRLLVSRRRIGTTLAQLDLWLTKDE